MCNDTVSCFVWCTLGLEWEGVLMTDNPHWYGENCRRNSFNVFRKKLGETRDTYRFKTRDLCVEIQNRDFSVTVEDCQPLSGIDWTKLADNNLASWRSWVNGLHWIPKPDQPEIYRNFSESLHGMQTCLVLHLFVMNSERGEKCPFELHRWLSAGHVLAHAPLFVVFIPSR
jgi:hypothetical protein